MFFDNIAVEKYSLLIWYKFFAVRSCLIISFCFVAGWVLLVDASRTHINWYGNYFTLYVCVLLFLSELLLSFSSRRLCYREQIACIAICFCFSFSCGVIVRFRGRGVWLRQAWCGNAAATEMLRNISNPEPCNRRLVSPQDPCFAAHRQGSRFCLLWRRCAHGH